MKKEAHLHTKVNAQDKVDTMKHLEATNIKMSVFIDILLKKMADQKKFKKIFKFVMDI